ncbi:hypothetical protein K9F62_10030 [Desulfovibrio sp. JY]|nr:hypothetical protein K9F62_10030 [Desulfovibrio sp. JY]
MPSFQEQSIYPPRHWQAFEDLCRDLWAAILNDKNTIKNGRGGQKQDGVDIYGREGGDGRYVGIQCKGKCVDYGHKLEEKELITEVGKAVKFEPSLSKFIIATTAPSDAPIQKKARLITQENERKGLFEVIVYGWEEIVSRLSEHRDVIRKHYSDYGREFVYERSCGDVSNFGQDVGVPNFKKDGVGYSGEPAPLLYQLDIGAAKINDIIIENEVVNREITKVVPYIDSRPRIAISMLEKILEECKGKADDNIRFRILTNIGACHFALNNQAEASNFFLRAFEFAPEGNDKALRNASLGYLLVGDLDNSNKMILQAIELNPTEPDGYSLLIASLGRDIDENEVNRLVPKECLKASSVNLSLGYAYKNSGNQERAIHFFNEAYLSEPSSPVIAAVYGTELFQFVMSENKALVEGCVDYEDVEKLKKSQKALQCTWETVKGTDFFESYIWVGINLTCLNSILGEIDNARAIIADMEKCGCCDMNFYEAAARVESDLYNYEAALKFIDKINEPLRRDLQIIKLQCLGCLNRFSEANNCLDTIDYVSSSEPYYSMFVRLKYKVIEGKSGLSLALDLARAEQKARGKDVFITIVVGDLLRRSGDKDGLEKELAYIKSLLKKQVSKIEKIAIADFLYRNSCYGDAVDIFKELVTERRDSGPLRSLIVCLFKLDRRRDLIDIFESIDRETKKKDFYLYHLAAVCVKIGEYAKAVENIDEYLLVKPGDLSIRNNWIDLNSRIGRVDNVKQFLSIYVPSLEASSEDLTDYAKRLQYYGFEKKSLELFYFIIRKYRYDGVAAASFISYVLLNKINLDNYEFDTVRADAAVTIRSDDGKIYKYIIESTYTDRVYDEEIPFESEIAQICNGKRIGERIAIDLNKYTELKGEIVSIESKYRYVLRKLIESFSRRFPGDQSFFVVDLKSKDGNIDFSPIFDMVDSKASQRLLAESYYKSKTFPLCVVAKSLHLHPFEVYERFSLDPSIGVICSRGDEYVRLTSLNCVHKKHKEFIVDPITLCALYDFGLLSVFDKFYGPIGITQSTLDLFFFYLDELNNSDHNGVFFKENGKYIYHEFEDGMLSETIDKYNRVLDWAKRKTKIYPASGGVVYNSKEMVGESELGLAFYDTLVAAIGNNLILMSDDFSYREIAALMGVKCSTWSEILCLDLKNRHLIGLEEYCRFYVEMIRRNYFLLSIDYRILYFVINNNNWEINDVVVKVFDIFKSKRASAVSLLYVAFDFLRCIWRLAIPLYVKDRFLWFVLNFLVINESFKVDMIVANFIELDKFIQEPQDGSYLDSLDRWLRGHFFVF